MVVCNRCVRRTYSCNTSFMMYTATCDHMVETATRSVCVNIYPWIFLAIEAGLELPSIPSVYVQRLWHPIMECKDCFVILLHTHSWSARACLVV
eukprot:jgi/Botrbrau1/4802/Bobra.0325s0024.1